MAWTELLRTILLFEGLSNEDVAELSRSVIVRHYQAGQIIFHQGDAGSSMFIVEEGHINIHLPGEASRRISLKDIARGEYFGELALFDDKPRSASAVATTDAVLLELEQGTFSSYLARRSNAALAIMRTMADRLRETNALLSARAARNVDAEIERNLRWSDRLADKVAELNGSWTFLLALLGLTGGWILLNSLGLVDRVFDPYPFVFFNLLLAVLVAMQGPLIVMSQNRQSTVDRARADTDYQVNLKNEVNIETILRELGEFRAEANLRLRDLEDASQPHSSINAPPLSDRGERRKA